MIHRGFDSVQGPLLLAPLLSVADPFAKPLPQPSDVASASGKKSRAVITLVLDGENRVPAPHPLVSFLRGGTARREVVDLCASQAAMAAVFGAGTQDEHMFVRESAACIACFMLEYTILPRI